MATPSIKFGGGAKVGAATTSMGGLPTSVPLPLDASSVHDLSAKLHHGLLRSLTTGTGFTDALVTLITVLLRADMQMTARIIASWPGESMVDDIESLLSATTASASAAELQAVVRDNRLAIQALGLLYRVGVSPPQLQRLFDYMHPTGHVGLHGVHGAVLAALETCAKARATLRTPPAFFSFPGWLHSDHAAGECLPRPPACVACTSSATTHSLSPPLPLPSSTRV
jgi:hypothetical protein